VPQPTVPRGTPNNEDDDDDDDDNNTALFIINMLGQQPNANYRNSTGGKNRITTNEKNTQK
jgi:hypothetical protein